MTDIEAVRAFDDVAQSVGALVTRVSDFPATFEYAKGLLRDGETVVAAAGIVSASGGRGTRNHRSRADRRRRRHPG
jgi:hypothetical protein